MALNASSYSCRRLEMSVHIKYDQISERFWYDQKSADGGMNRALMLTKVSRKLYDPFAMIHCFQTWWHSLSRLLSFDASMSTRRAIVVCYYASV